MPEKVERIVALASGAPRIAAYLQAMDLLVGAEDHDIKKVEIRLDYNPVYHEQLKKLPSVGKGGGSGANNAYAEEIIKLSPQVIVASFSKEAAEELERQTGIPVVCTRYTSKGLANESFYQSMRVFAELIGKQERCEELLTFIDDCKADLGRRTEKVDDAKKLKAYTGAVTFNGAHGFAGTYAKFGPFDAIHAKNVADEVDTDGFYEANLEKILEWDPDVIFLDPGNIDLVKDEVKSNPDYFNSLRAVKEGHVYTMPSFNNRAMNITYALMNAYYAGTVLFPEEFKDIDMAKKGGEILTKFLGVNTYDQMQKGGLYYGELKLGE